MSVNVLRSAQSPLVRSLSHESAHLAGVQRFLSCGTETDTSPCWPSAAAARPRASAGIETFGSAPST